MPERVANGKNARFCLKTYSRAETIRCITHIFARGISFVPGPVTEKIQIRIGLEQVTIFKGENGKSRSIKELFTKTPQRFKTTEAEYLVLKDIIGLHPARQ